MGLGKYAGTFGDNSAATCAARCKKLGYRYAGTQFYKQCFCGNSFGKYGKAKCSTKCPGNKGICGGGWANSVYQIGGAVSKTAAKKVVKKIAKKVAKAKKAVAKVAKKPTKKALKVVKKIVKKAKKVVKPKKVAPKPKVAVTYAAKGCYKDSGRRDLPKYMGYSKSNSKAQCGSKCNAKGFRYFSTQWTGQCFCGNTFGKYGKSKNCNMKCAGNKKEICGGGWANNVYQIVRGSGKGGIKLKIKVSSKKVGKKGKKLVKKAKKVIKKVAKKGKKAAKKVIKKVVKKAKKAVKKAKKSKSAKKVVKAKKALKVVKKIAKKAKKVAKKAKKVAKKPAAKKVSKKKVVKKAKKAAKKIVKKVSSKKVGKKGKKLIKKAAKKVAKKPTKK